MYNKIKISGKIKVVTGMHIGGSSAFSAIGAVDSPVIRDKQSDLPMNYLKREVKNFNGKRVF